MKWWQSFLLTVGAFLLISYVLSWLFHMEFKWWLDIAVPAGFVLGSYLVQRHRNKRVD